MKLLRTRLVNVCQHADQEVLFAPRMHGVCGPNGSGKSNLASMTYAAITNDFTRNAGVKSANVRQLADDKSPAYVETDFQHGSTFYRVVRGLRGKTTALWKADNPEFEDATKVAAGDDPVTEVLRNEISSAKILDKYVFPAQTQLTQWIDDKPSSRAEFFERLFKLEQARKCLSVLTEHLSQVQIVDVTEQLEEQRAELRVEKGKFAQLEEEMLPYEEFLEYSESTDPLSETVNEYRRRAVYESEAVKEAENLQSLEQEYDDAVSRRESSEKTLTSLLSAAGKARETARASRDILVTHKSYKRLVHRKQTCESELESLRYQISKLEPPAYVMEPKRSLEDARQVLGELESLQRRDKSDRRKLMTGNCPTCGQAAPADVTARAEQIDERINARSSEIADIQEAISALEADWAAWTKYRQRVERHESQRKALQDKIADAKKTLASIVEELDGAEAVDADVDELQSQIEDCEAVIANCEEHEKRHQKLVTKEAVLKQSVADVSQRIRKLDAQIEAITVTKDEYESAIRTIEERANKHRKAVTLDAQLNAIVGVTSRLAASIKKLKTIHEENKKLLAWREYVEQMRDVLRDLPKVVTMQYLELLAAECNEELQLFEHDFAVWPTEDLNFIANFADGRVQPMQRLSGGQKVALAIAFLVAVNAVFASEIGMLWLDEPTEYMDDIRLESLRKVLLRMRERAGNAGLQVILITHVRQFDDLFDGLTVLDSNGG